MRSTVVCTMLALGALGGCGTVLNLSEPSAVPVDVPTKRVYGGVQIDNQYGTKYRQRDPDGNDADLRQAVLWAATVVDLPLSAIGDTLTLPLTLWWRSQAAGQTAPPASPAAAVEAAPAGTR